MSHTGRVLDEGDSPGIIRVVTTGQIIISYKQGGNSIQELIFRIPKKGESYVAFTNKKRQFIRGDAVRINLKNPKKYQKKLKRIKSNANEVFKKNKHWKCELENLDEINSRKIKYRIKWEKHTAWPKKKQILYAQQLKYLPHHYVLDRLYMHLACISYKEVETELETIYSNKKLSKKLFRPSLVAIGDDFYPVHKVFLLSQKNIKKRLSKTKGTIVYHDPLDDVIIKGNHLHVEDDHAMDGKSQCPIIIRPL